MVLFSEIRMYRNLRMDMETNPNQSKKKRYDINKCICFIRMTSNDAIAVQAHLEMNYIVQVRLIIQINKWT